MGEHQGSLRKGGAAWRTEDVKKFGTLYLKYQGEHVQDAVEFVGVDLRGHLEWRHQSGSCSV